MTTLRRLAPRISCAAISCAAALLVAAPASAYVRQHSSSNGTPLKWTQLPVRFNVYTRAAQGVSNAQLVAAVRAAYSEWTKPACTNVSVKDLGSTNSEGDRQDGINTNTWLASWPSNYGSNTLGLTLTSYNPQTGAINDADTVYNPNYTWSVNGSSFAIDAQSVATHEIGHQLGLDHTPITSATMFASTGQGDTSQRSLASDDIQGICAIYPSGSSSTSPECTTKNDCAPNEDCQGGKCVAAAGGKGYGGPCDGPDACSSGICLRSNGVQVCTQLCDSQACPGGDQCVSVSSSTGQSAKACLPGTADTGTVDLGQACQVNADCKSKLCISVPGSGYLCSKTCAVGSNECGSGYRCAPGNVGGLCIPGSGSTTPGTPQTKKQLGDACGTHADCESGLCGSGPAGNVCTQFCSDADPCPTGYACAGVKGSDKGACIASGPAPGALGSGCTSNSDCNSKLCAGGSDGKKFCTELCQPTSGCPGPFDCAPAGGGKYACVAKPGTNPADDGSGGGGGCAIGASDSAPLGTAPLVPIALAGLALLLLGVRRRRR